MAARWSGLTVSSYYWCNHGTIWRFFSLTCGGSSGGSSCCDNEKMRLTNRGTLHALCPPVLLWAWKSFWYFPHFFLLLSATTFLIFYCASCLCAFLKMCAHYKVDLINKWSQKVRLLAGIHRLYFVTLAHILISMRPGYNTPDDSHLVQLKGRNVMIFPTTF